MLTDQSKLDCARIDSDRKESLDPIEARAELVRFSHASARAGLMGSTCGNASLKIDAHRFLITGTGTELAHLRDNEIALVSIDDGRHLDGPLPSVEAELHRLVYAGRASARAILHCQSRAATLAACMVEPPENLDFIGEIPAYVGRFASVPFLMPGSPELAQAVAVAFADPEVTTVQMRNHGQVLIGSSWAKAIRRGVFFELACWMAVQGVPLTRIPTEQADELRRMSSV